MADNSVDKILSEEMIDATLADSFPASDPPSCTLGREKQPTRNRLETVVEPKDENMWDSLRILRDEFAAERGIGSH